jgi:hypothetical protein
MDISFTTNPMRHKIIDGLLMVKPTKTDVENLKVGDEAPNCFGRFGKVVSITYRGININGKAYVGYDVEWHGKDSCISGSLTEDETFDTVPLTSKYSRPEFYPKVF